MTTTADLLLEWDRRRARSQQRELGMSEVGGCRRRAGYRLAGVEPTDQGGSVQAVMGTAIHAAVEAAFHAMQTEGLIPPGDLVEHEVRFAGILGHLDRYDSVEHTVYDTKTTNDNWLKHIKLHGPDTDHLWQVHLYGAALVAAGHPVRTVVIDYLARDTGDTWQVVRRFEPAVVRDALQWLATVRDVDDPEMLNRDYAPETAFCGHCPFRSRCWAGAVPDRNPLSVLFVEDPDARRWAQQLADARADKADAKAREDEARGALDALRPNETGVSDPVDVGLEEWALQWTISNPKRLDTDAVRAEYAKTGVKPPIKTGHEIRLSFVPKGGQQ